MEVAMAKSEGITEVTELMFVLDQDSDVSDHDPLKTHLQVLRSKHGFTI